MYVSAYCHICVSILLCMCPHAAAIYVSAYCYVRARRAWRIVQQRCNNSATALQQYASSRGPHGPPVPLVLVVATALQQYASSRVPDTTLTQQERFFFFGRQVPAWWRPRRRPPARAPLWRRHQVTQGRQAAQVSSARKETAVDP
jgi:hypothetical protein